MLAESPGGRCQAGVQDKGDPRALHCAGHPAGQTERPLQRHAGQRKPQRTPLRGKGPWKNAIGKRQEEIPKGEERRFRQILSLTQN